MDVDLQLKQARYKQAFTILNDQIAHTAGEEKNFYLSSLLCRLFGNYKKEKQLLELAPQDGFFQNYFRERAEWHKTPLEDRLQKRKIKRAKEPLQKEIKKIVDKMCFIINTIDLNFVNLIECIDSIRALRNYDYVPIFVVEQTKLSDEQKDALKIKGVEITNNGMGKAAYSIHMNSDTWMQNEIGLNYFISVMIKNKINAINLDNWSGVCPQYYCNALGYGGFPVLYEDDPHELYLPNTKQPVSIITTNQFKQDLFSMPTQRISRAFNLQGLFIHDEFSKHYGEHFSEESMRKLPVSMARNPLCYTYTSFRYKVLPDEREEMKKLLHAN